MYKEKFIGQTVLGGVLKMFLAPGIFKIVVGLSLALYSAWHMAK